MADTSNKTSSTASVLPTSVATPSDVASVQPDPTPVTPGSDTPAADSKPEDEPAAYGVGGTYIINGEGKRVRASE